MHKGYRGRMHNGVRMRFATDVFPLATSTKIRNRFRKITNKIFDQDRPLLYEVHEWYTDDQNYIYVKVTEATGRVVVRDVRHQPTRRIRAARSALCGVGGKTVLPTCELDATTGEPDAFEPYARQQIYS